MPNYRYDERLGGGTGRYVNKKTGRIVSNAVVRNELDRMLSNSAEPMDTLYELLRERRINLADFRQQGMTIIKNTHVGSIAMQRGGYANMTPADYGRAGNKIREQYGFWNKRVDAIKNGTQRIDGTLKRRMNMYVESGRESFNNSARAYATDNGATHVGSTLNPADHCVECVAFNGKWYRVGDSAYKPPGSRICRKNCKCSERYGIEQNGAITEV